MPARRTIRAPRAWLLCALAGAPAFAQSQATQAPTAQPGALQPLDQGHEDIGALNASLWVERADLRSAAGFDRVYRATDNSGRLMRVDGALHAVFRESEYVATAAGDAAVIPAGTTWTIGEPSVGCTDAKPICDQLPAQAPYLMPGATGFPARRTANSQPPPNSVSPAPLSRAERVGQPLSTPEDSRLSIAVLAEPASNVEVASRPERLGNSPMPRDFDMSDEFYRRLRLREIARRYAPQP